MSAVFLSRERPVARKQHRCSLCHRTIRVGETYDRQGNVYDGRAYTFKTCLHCHALVTLYPEIWEYADDGYTDEDVHDWEPRTIAAARHRAQYRRQWERLDGDLYPIPSKESA